MTYSVKELEKWNLIIEELAKKMGLDFYEQEFEIVDFEEMIGLQTYVGMPSHYPHWSLGKSYEKTKTLHKYNLTGLPYETVINSNPCLAYLMKDNTLLLQILTIAHVYGHNDFFKNNRLFKEGTNADRTLQMFKNHADRVRAYTKYPSIGYGKVERILDAAHALKYQSSRAIGRKRLSYKEQRKLILGNLNKPEDNYRLIKPKVGTEESKAAIAAKIPLHPEEDLLFFLSQFAHLEEWERDLINIVAEETRYFLPQIETKIMNEGWASFWHYTLINELNLEHGLYLEFIKRHNQVLSPALGRINPYYLGFKVFQDLEKRFGREKIFEVRELERDQSFIWRYLTYDLCKEMNLFEYAKKDKAYVVTEVSDEEGWESIRNSLALSVGMNGIPGIKVIDLEKKSNTVTLQHEFDGRELELNYANQTLKHFAEIWGGKVQLLTQVDDKEITITCYEDKTVRIL